MGSATTIATWAGAIHLTLEQLGLDGDAILLKAGIKPELIRSHKNRILVTRMTSLWRHCVAESGREDFGLLVARNAFPMTFHSLGLAMSSSQTLLHALKILRGHSKLVSDIASVSVIKKPGSIEIMIVLDDQQTPPSHESIDAFLAVLASAPPRFTGAQPGIKEVHMRRPPPENQAPFIDTFGEVIYFSAPVDALIVETNSLTRFLPSFNAEIAQESEQKLRAFRLGAGHLSHSDKTLVILENRLDAGYEHFPTIEMVAQELHLTPRTLQNHLKNENTSYQALLNQVREGLAKKLLTRSDYDIAQISEQLGFSSASNFNRAFKSWTDVTVREYRLKNR